MWGISTMYSLCFPSSLGNWAVTIPDNFSKLCWTKNSLNMEGGGKVTHSITNFVSKKPYHIRSIYSVQSLLVDHSMVLAYNLTIINVSHCTCKHIILYKESYTLKTFKIHSKIQ